MIARASRSLISAWRGRIISWLSLTQTSWLPPCRSKCQLFFFNSFVSLKCCKTTLPFYNSSITRIKHVSMINDKKECQIALFERIFFMKLINNLIIAFRQSDKSFFANFSPKIDCILSCQSSNLTNRIVSKHFGVVPGVQIYKRRFLQASIFPIHNWKIIFSNSIRLVCKLASDFVENGNVIQFP